MNINEKNILEHWVQLIKPIFLNDAEFEYKNDFNTKNYLISVLRKNNDQDKNIEPIIITITKETISKYLGLSEEAKKVADKKFYQCIKDKRYFIKPADLNLNNLLFGLFRQIMNCFKT